MTTAKIDRVDFVEAQEIHGVIVRLVRRARVIEIPDTSYTALFTALAAAGVPAADSTLAGASNLTLTERNPSIVEGDPGTVDVDLIYTKFDNKGQSLDAPPLGLMTGSVRVSVQQLSRNTDIDGLAVSVEHTWPNDDPDHPGEIDVQGGEFQAQVPQRTFTVEGFKITNKPWIIANAIIGRVNSGTFSGEPKHEWMCVAANWRIADNDVASNRYFMSFEFQHNSDTWNPSVIFIDPRTGKPPVDLIQDVGFKNVRVNPEANFEAILGVRVQGA